ncbi:MAG: tail fiber domain-containing protein [Chloroflexi bacterium]|nr:tail fiber domain-containing protein [Chloroflexota bacterium]MBU1746650.1 tail fiber domain-containing protein [Chloroflexota bacterium]
MKTNHVCISLAVLVTVAVLLGAVGLQATAGPQPRPLQQAGAPTVVSYQGYVTVSGTPYTGAGYFKFVVVNGSGGTEWSNDGTSVGGGAPTTAVQLTVASGLFNVLLGDTALTNMTALSAGVFDETERYLRVWFSSDGSSFDLLSPDRRIAAVPYALQAEDVKNAWRLTGNAGTTPGTHFLGTTDNAALELHVNGARVLRLEPDATSPNVVGGYSGNGVDAGAIGVAIGGGGASGATNRATGDYDVVGGGYHNQAGDDDGNPATGRYATVGGGRDNTASGGRATVSGGDNNTASGTLSTVLGGQDNVAASSYSLAAGRRAQAAHEGAFVWADATDADFGSTADNELAVRATGGVRLTIDTDGGGLRLEPNATSPNVVGGHGANSVQSNVRGATVSGGGTSSGPNRVTDFFGTVGGGRNNQAGDGDGNLNNTPCATVAGGDDNVANGYYSFIGGGNENWAGQVAVVGGGNLNVVSATTGFIGAGWGNVITGHNYMWFDSIVGGQFNLITGPVQWSFIGGGDRNQIVGVNRAFIGGGQQNTINSSGGAAVIGGGEANTVSGDRATIGGGDSNTASGGRSTVGGGYSNEAGGDFAATIAGGYDNTTSGNSAAVGGGRENSAGGLRSTVPGGYQNAAAGDYSLAAGRRAQADHDGAFVWGDSTNADVASTGNNQFIVRASGGVYLYTNSGLTSGMYLATGGSAWNAVSDRARKENLAPVDEPALLARLAEVPITTWNYKSQDASIRHIGPMAQDFNTLVEGLGGEGADHINSLDADGVALAAIQGLYAQNKALEAENTRLKAENAAQQTQLEGLEARVAALEARVSGGPASAAPWTTGLLPGAGVLALGLGLVGVAWRGDVLGRLKGGRR